MSVDPETYTVTADGEVLSAEPARVAPARAEVLVVLTMGRSRLPLAGSVCYRWLQYRLD